MKNTKFNVIGSIFGILLAAISCVVCFPFFNAGFKSSAEYNSKVSTYEKSDYDYVVYNPIDSQIPEIKNESSVKDVFEYYLYDSTITLNSKEYETKAMFSTNTESLKISTFNSSRLISGEYNLSDGIYIDLIVAEKIGAKVGDQVNLSMSQGVSLGFTVKAVFETNTFYDNGTVFFAFSGNTKSSIDAKRTVALSGAMIQANDKNSCFEYLKTYIPYGEMLTRDYFESDLEYNQYVSDFESADYSSKIFKKQAYLESIQTSNANLLSDAETKVKTGAIIASVVSCLIVALSVYAIKYESDYEKRTKAAIPNKTYRIGVNAIIVATYVLSFALSFVVGSIVHFGIRIHSSLIGVLGGSLSISMIVSMVVVLLASNMILLKVNNKKLMKSKQI